jgi:uncharacterized membrane protein YraQ (UPF0718 family)
VFDGTLLLLTAIVGALAAVAYARGGEELLRRGLFDGGALLWRYAILICISFLAAGLAAAVLPEAWVARTFGAESGFGAILVATGIGVVTPAGPFVAIPIAAVMIRNGATAGPVVAFISGWSLLALHRFIAWEVPMLGWRFAALRYGSCLLLPPLAGWIARTVTR